MLLRRVLGRRLVRFPVGTQVLRRVLRKGCKGSSRDKERFLEGFLERVS